MDGAVVEGHTPVYKGAGAWGLPMSWINGVPTPKASDMRVDAVGLGVIIEPMLTSMKEQRVSSPATILQYSEYNERRQEQKQQDKRPEGQAV